MEETRKWAPAAPRREARARSPVSLWLDLEAEVLWRDGSRVPLRPKTWDVLRRLAERPGVLVTKEELLDEVWGDVVVTEGTLSKSIAELREALGDDARSPKFIATIHRRGFRLLDELPVAAGHDAVPAAAPAATPPRAGATLPFVGRDDELRRLRLALTEASGGARRVVFVTGEPGSGKTTLVETLIRTLLTESDAANVAVATGNVVRELGDAEPFFPVLEALRGLARGARHPAVIEALREQGPGWLHLVRGVAPGEPVEVAVDELGSPTRMLLKLVRTLEALARERPLVLVLDDLHWADRSTLDLLAVLARSREPTRLLVIATYRPAEAVLRGDHLDQLRRELRRDPRAVHIPLELLSVADAIAFLRTRFGGAEPPEGLAVMLHVHTEGNPLFLATAVDHLVDQGWLCHADQRLTLGIGLDAIDAALPTSLVDLVDLEARRLSADEGRALEAGSVAGTEFSVQEVAAALEKDVEEVERHLERLAASWRFVRPIGADEWPDGTTGSRWQFVHALHRRVFLARVAAARLQRWHQRIGERLEVGWGQRRTEIAPILASHFEASRDSVRALEYLDAAARVAEQRCAPTQARELLGRALGRRGEIDADPARRERELDLRLRLTAAINAADGYASPELREHLVRAIALSSGPGHERLRFRLTYNLLYVHVAADDPRAKDQLRALSTRAEALGIPAARLVGDVAGDLVAVLEGRYRDAVHLEPLVETRTRVDDDLYVGSRFEVLVPALEALRRWPLGDADAAGGLAEKALARARDLPDRLNEAFALFCATQIAAWDRDAARLEVLARRSEVLTREHGYHYWGALVGCLHGWSRALLRPGGGGFDALRSRIEEHRAHAGALHLSVLLAGLAEVALAEERFDEGLAVVAQGLASIESGLARMGHPELHRIRAALRRATGKPAHRVREDLEAALAIAGQQGAGAFAARASADLERLTQRRTCRAAARRAP